MLGDSTRGKRVVPGVPVPAVPCGRPRRAAVGNWRGTGSTLPCRNPSVGEKRMSEAAPREMRSIRVRTRFPVKIRLPNPARAGCGARLGAVADHPSPAAAAVVLGRGSRLEPGGQGWGARVSDALEVRGVHLHRLGLAACGHPDREPSPHGGCFFVLSHATRQQLVHAVLSPSESGLVSLARVRQRVLSSSHAGTVGHRPRTTLKMVNAVARVAAAPRCCASASHRPPAFTTRQ